ncbi:HpcH/HpaI aldolase family protein [Nakamurella leprariae]|uniref:HpcH/HpaI aldolase/citrate lyase domain-containing protein n=1 Tax=Nakamurella leprariae TaxID=2803911 RepID=A0A939BY53_9ACTN|nr:aldolase/citrate lyase family protein [Nakamurella leprariae]MBM9466720.1 hypothetical protein [Nakamurella leprariae]
MTATATATATIRAGADHRTRIERAVAARGVAVGTSVGLGIPEGIAVAAAAGLDFVQIDGEHTHLPIDTINTAAALAAALDIAVLVRVPEVTATAVTHTLATGVTGIIAPRIETRSQAEALVRHAHLPPRGTRGVGGRRPLHEPAHSEQDERHTQLWIIIETARGIEHLAEILAVRGISAVLPGPFDLSYDLGVPGRVDHPTVRAGVDEIYRVCVEQGVPVIGSHTTEPGGARTAHRKGARLLLAPADTGVLQRAHAANRAEIMAAVTDSG